MKAVLHTSVLAAAFLARGGVNNQVLQAGGKGYDLSLSEGILEDLRRVLLTYSRIRDRYRYNDEDVKEFIRQLRNVGHVVTEWPEIQVIKEDPADDMILACALAVNAEYVVSKDVHLNNLGEYQGIRLVSRDEFLQLLKRRI